MGNSPRPSWISPPRSTSSHSGFARRSLRQRWELQLRAFQELQPRGSLALQQAFRFRFSPLCEIATHWLAWSEVLSPSRRQGRLRRQIHSFVSPSVRPPDAKPQSSGVSEGQAADAAGVDGCVRRNSEKAEGGNRRCSAALHAGFFSLATRQNRIPCEDETWRFLRSL